MKVHECKICGYTSTRKNVRKHMKDGHKIKGAKRDKLDNKTKSQISNRMK